MLLLKELRDETSGVNLRFKWIPHREYSFSPQGLSQEVSTQIYICVETSWLRPCGEKKVLAIGDPSKS